VTDSVRVSTGAGPADAETIVAMRVPYRLAGTLAIHRRGGGDPAFRIEQSGAVWVATRRSTGPATMFLQPVADGVRVRGWGAGAGEAIAGAGAFLGADDDPAALVPVHPAVAEGARQGRGLRIGRSSAVF
jgi:hypothetical protein